jgi:homoserine dehydrogenase
MKTLRLGILGGGTVGSNVLTLLWQRRDLIRALGVNLEIAPVLVKNMKKPRPTLHPNVTFTGDPAAVGEVDVLLELIGGTTRALELILPHLEAGKPVITANKAMLAERWDVLKPHAQRGQIFFEAAVMAGTPVITSMTCTLRSSELFELHAILNGTCNYILSRMEEGAEYADALQEALDNGYAEDPPDLDVLGVDPAHKLCMLARLAVDADFAWDRLEMRGITELSGATVRGALERGKRVKLVGSLVPQGGVWRAVVRPVILDATHPLAGSSASRNAIVLHGDACGTIVLQGGGAGGMVTASAIVGDLIAFMEGNFGHTPRATPAPARADYTPEVFEEI